MRFDFATASRILFGPGVLEEIAHIAPETGRKALLVTGRQGADTARLTGLLDSAGVGWERFVVDGEPAVETVQAGSQAARAAGCDFTIGFGGGSALDAAKAIAAVMTNPGDLMDYLEVVGRGLPLPNLPAPFIAIPTTAGTGSEVTRNAVLAVPEQRVKVSLRSPHMLARAALVDPQLTFSLPPEVTASTGMDALAQVIEPYVSSRANPFTDLYCRAGIARAARSLFNAYRDGQDAAAREDMAFASLMGGLALANAGLGAVHGFAGPLGGMFDAPHGAVCAALLPPVVAVNASALAKRAPDHPALARYREIAGVVTGSRSATVADLTRWLGDLRQALGIPSLAQYGVQPAHLGDLAAKGQAASSMKANPIPLEREELVAILEAAL
jgi:alcohol dehydrogenase class IV